MDKDKPRERDTQLPGLGSAKRILARGTVRLGGARPCPPHGAVDDFFGRVRP
jgi:hypothetical protein